MEHLKKFKKLHEDETTAVLQHADGHQVKIAKKALSPAMRKQLGTVAYAEGGQVENMSRDPAQALPGMWAPVSPQEQQSMSYDVPPSQATSTAPGDVAGIPKTSNATPPQFTDDKAAPAQDAYQASNPVPAASASTMDQGTAASDALAQNQLKGMQNAYGQQAAGIKAAAKAETDLGNKLADAAQQRLEMQQQHQLEFQSDLKDIDKERAAVQFDIKNQHINPNEWWDHKSTGGKIATVIGMLIGGFTGNSTNDWIKQQVDKSVDAQKAELGKKNNLLAANMQRFRNLKDAEDMTRVMMNDQVASQVDAIKSKAMGPAAAANAQILSGQLAEKTVPMQQALASRIAARRMVDQGKMTPEQSVHYIIQDPKEKTEALKELGSINAMNALQEESNRAFDEVNHMVFRGALSPHQRQSYIDTIAGKLQHASEGRFNPEQAKIYVEGFFPTPGDFSKGTQDVKRQNMNSFFDVQKENHPTLTANGIKTPAPQGGGFKPR